MQVDRQTYRQTHMLTAIHCTPTGDEVINKNKS